MVDLCNPLDDALPLYTNNRPLSDEELISLINLA
jgi:hypothetical protein